MNIKEITSRFSDLSAQEIKDIYTGVTKELGKDISDHLFGYVLHELETIRNMNGVEFNWLYDAVDY